MDINTYLRYNNVALIDPTNDFQASCIKQYNTQGFLSHKQLSSLREWAHSTEAINRLVAQLPTQETTATVEPEPVVTQTVSGRKMWTPVEIETLCSSVEKGTTSLETLAKAFNCTPLSAQNILRKNSSTCTVKKGVVIQFERLPF